MRRNPVLEAALVCWRVRKSRRGCLGYWPPWWFCFGLPIRRGFTPVSARRQPPAMRWRGHRCMSASRWRFSEAVGWSQLAVSALVGAYPQPVVLGRRFPVYGQRRVVQPVAVGAGWWRRRAAAGELGGNGCRPVCPRYRTGPASVFAEVAFALRSVAGRTGLGRFSVGGGFPARFDLFVAAFGHICAAAAVWGSVWAVRVCVWTT